MLRDLSVLSHDSMEGRRTGTQGIVKARQFIKNEFSSAGLMSYGDSYEQPFEYRSNGEEHLGVNIVGFVPGSKDSDLAIVLSAHYDHLGVRDDMVFNGADDNASGTAALLALARHIVLNPLQHTAVFLAADAEESGLQGARAFVRRPPRPEETIAVNVNMDMISHADSILFAAGTYHYPALLAPMHAVASRSAVVLRFGHDRPDLARGEDWTNSSDHAPFHAAGIPFIYFGVEDHPDYHQPTDDFENINPHFYRGAVQTVLDAVMELDRNLETVRTP